MLRTRGKKPGSGNASGFLFSNNRCDGVATQAPPAYKQTYQGEFEMTDAREPRARDRRLVALLVASACLTGASLAFGAAPAASAATAPQGHTATAARSASTPAKKPVAVKRIDINSASRKELKTLPGIGDAEADKIIAHRPYLVSTEIVDKAGLPAGVYVAIKRKIVAMPKTKPKAKPPAKSSS